LKNLHLANYKTNSDFTGKTILYISPEYGISDSLPNYSGGLGILAGDHLKSASDLGIQTIAFGLFYKNGYFRQTVDSEGNQNADYIDYNPENLPVEPVIENGSPKIFRIKAGKEDLFFRMWKCEVGSSILYLLDSDVEENSQDFRQITDKLYGGDREKRILQEILLGIGTIRAAQEMNLMYDMLHINEGHAAFALLERAIIKASEEQIDFSKAYGLLSESTVFTTHTPVIHGNEVFKAALIRKYLKPHLENNLIDYRDFMALGNIDMKKRFMELSMTVLALKLSSHRNGVSQLHGKVARNMWKKIWPELNEDEIPISGITNGIHHKTWVSNEFDNLYKNKIDKDWHLRYGDDNIWNKIYDLPNEEIRKSRLANKRDLIDFLISQFESNPPNYINNDFKKTLETIETNELIIGFARRFAPYKRAMLVMNNPEKLKRILTENKVRLIFSGKAHPADTDGQEILKNLARTIQKYGLEDKILFIEDYDIETGKNLVRGCDVWLNTPVRPMEASGTSGMKSSLNGGINFSVPDGWWDEAYNGKNGYLIGSRKSQKRITESNEAELLYDVLENEVIPDYFGSGSGISDKWIDKIKESIRTVVPLFSSYRMLSEYKEKLYKL
jgi:starch phosphorylase